MPLPELTQAMRVNLEAPLVLSAAFLRATAGSAARRRLVFFSSGLGRAAMAGASARVLASIDRAEFGSQPVTDVRAAPGA